jgi:hypothetical protein
MHIKILRIHMWSMSCHSAMTVISMIIKVAAMYRVNAGIKNAMMSVMSLLYIVGSQSMSDVLITWRREVASSFLGGWHLK